MADYDPGYSNGLNLDNYNDFEQLESEAKNSTFSYQSGSDMINYHANKANDASQGIGKQK